MIQQQKTGCGREENRLPVNHRPGRVRQLRRQLAFAFAALLIAFAATAAATFAWYIYNTSAHTTKVKLAAGTSINLQISNQRDGKYESAATLNPDGGAGQSFVGILTPVSTNDVRAGFQKAVGFESSGTGTGLGELWARAFGLSQPEEQDYYKTSLYLRTNAPAVDVYLADIDYGAPDGSGGVTKTQQDRMMSTAMRIGFVVYAPGSDSEVTAQYIYALNEEDHITAPNNNTAPGQSFGQTGSFAMDPANLGQVVAFTPYSKANFCEYDRATGAVETAAQSVRLCPLSGSGTEYGAATRVDVYLWLEGCDPDCTNELCGMTLSNLSILFAGVSPEEAAA